jgi:membrane-bound serine protease (ClpP class)
MKRFLAHIILLYAFVLGANAQADSSKNLVYVLPIMRQIGSTSWVHTQEAFKHAERLKPVCIIVHMNTYGGQVDFADSIRTKILNSKIPVHVFIDNNAASAGALISIACDSIYMRPGANIGAATVVNQNGEKMPDKYQSYMRSTIRATAEAHGGDTLINGNDTIVRWVRDPRIAEAMVDESIYIAGIIDTGKILTFTTREAIKHGYCEGEANSLNEVCKHLDISNPTFVTFEPSVFHGIKGFVTSPILQGLLILVILGGIYFELQTPGIGFPLGIAVVAAVLYFAPLYIDGLAENWEIILFIVGLGLLAVEVFVIPGFGITGIAGVILMVMGLTLSLVNNVVFDFTNVSFTDLFEAMLIVVLGFLGAFFGGIYLTKRVLKSGPFARVALQMEMTNAAGFVGVDTSVASLIGIKGTASTILRPSGKVLIDGELYDAVALTSYIEMGSEVKVVGLSSGQLQVVKV